MESAIIPAFLIGLLLTSCGGASQPLLQNTSAPSDCGVFSADGQDCFEAAMASCSPSTVLLFENVPPVSASITGTSGSSSCVISVRGMGKAEIDRIMLSNGASQSEVDGLNAKIDTSPGFSSLEGKTGTCIVGKLKASEFATSYTYSCSGPLIDSIKGMGLVEKFAR